MPIDRDARNWLKELEIETPNEESRNPTGDEIKAGLNALSGFRKVIYDNGIGMAWQAEIVAIENSEVSEWACLNIGEYAGDDKQQSIYFSGGTMPAMIMILIEISKFCGPLILVDASDCTPIVITHNKSRHS